MGREREREREREQRATHTNYRRREKKRKTGEPKAGSSSLLGSRKPNGASKLALHATSARKDGVAERGRRAESGFLPFAMESNCSLNQSHCRNENCETVPAHFRASLLSRRLTFFPL